MPNQDPITELRQLLLTSQQEQLKISRSLLTTQQAHTEAVEASLRLNRWLMLAMGRAACNRWWVEPVRAVAEGYGSKACDYYRGASSGERESHQR